MGEDTVAEPVQRLDPAGLMGADASPGQTRVLMVVKEAEAREAYEEVLRNVGVVYEIAGSFSEVLNLSVERAYSGMIIDILTLIRSSKEEKQIAYDCINFYPSLRVKWDPRQKTVNLTPLEQKFTPDTETTVRAFIENRCRPFSARSLRKHNRKETFLAVTLSTCDHSKRPETLKSFTVNISQGGAFVHTTRPFAKGDRVLLDFIDLADSGPVRGAVCWQIAWGACRSIPGIGLMFDYASQEQEEQVRKMARV